MEYKLAPHVTAEMLEEVGFANFSKQGTYYKPIQARGNGICIWQETREIFWNCQPEKTSIKQYIQDLISKGYVIEE